MSNDLPNPHETTPTNYQLPALASKPTKPMASEKTIKKPINSHPHSGVIPHPAPFLPSHWLPLARFLQLRSTPRYGTHWFAQLLQPTSSSTSVPTGLQLFPSHRLRFAHKDLAWDYPGAKVQGSPPFRECTWCRVQGSPPFRECTWCRVQGSPLFRECTWCRVQGEPPFRECTWCRVQGSPPFHECTWYRVQGSPPFRECTWCRVQGSPPFRECT